jgi:hypothetical protein
MCELQVHGRSRSRLSDSGILSGSAVR